MKRVLILGDSISISYREKVKEKLKGLCEVVFPEENGQFTYYTLWALHLWIKQLGKPDIVHWNNGLWDTHHEPPRIDALTPIDVYEQNLRRIITELRRYDNPQIIWASTIPAHYNFKERSNYEIDQYNAVAAKVMQEENIPVNDLHSLIKKDIGGYICEDMVHLTEEAAELCAQQVADTIKKYL